MSRPTVIANLGENACVIEPSSATWYVVRAGAATCDASADGHALAPLREAASGRLDEAWIYTNLDCNLSCSHCFVGDVAAARASRPSLDRLISLVDEAVALGARAVFFTGGEPFAREDFPQLLAHAASVATAAVLTNATLITARAIAQLDAAGLALVRDRLSIQVSIDGPCEVHDAIRGAGAFDRALAGVRELVAWGVRPALVTTLTGESVATAHEVTRLAGELGLGVHHLLLPHRDGRLECDCGSTAPTPSRILSAVRAARRVAEHSGVTLSNDAVIAGRVRRPGRRFDGCIGGSSMLVAGADGRFYPCPALVGDERFGAQAESFAEARDAAPVGRFAESSLCDRTQCAACAVRHFCGGGCPAHVARAGEAIPSAEPYCEVYRGLVGDHIRAEAARLLAEQGASGEGPLRPTPAPSAGPVRHRFACT